MEISFLSQTDGVSGIEGSSGINTQYELLCYNCRNIHNKLILCLNEWCKYIVLFFKKWNIILIKYLNVHKNVETPNSVCGCVCLTVCACVSVYGHG